MGEVGGGPRGEDGFGDRLQVCAGAGVDSAEQGRMCTVGGDWVVWVVVMMVIDLHKGVWWEEDQECLRGAGGRLWMRHCWMAPKQLKRGEKQSLQCHTRAVSAVCHSIFHLEAPMLDLHFSCWVTCWNAVGTARLACSNRRAIVLEHGGENINDCLQRNVIERDLVLHISDLYVQSRLIKKQM